MYIYIYIYRTRPLIINVYMSRLGITVIREKGAVTLMGNNSGGKGVSSVLQSPFPYSLGGVFVILLLMAIVLIFLVFSYWKKSGSDQARNEAAQGTRESVRYGEKNDVTVNESCDYQMEGKVTVIMAGDEMPTFLATPVMLAKPAGGRISVIIV